jgi:hypothetical protein
MEAGRKPGLFSLCARQGALTNGLKSRAGLPWEPQDCGDGGCLSDKTRSVRGNREPHFLVPRRFQWVDLQDRLSPTASGSQQPGVPIALKAWMTRSLVGGNDDLACDEKSPHFRYVPPGKLGFYAVSQLLDATLTLLTTTGAIAVDLWDQSRSGQETSKSPPYLGSACCPLKVARNQRAPVFTPLLASL